MGGRVPPANPERRDCDSQWRTEADDGRQHGRRRIDVDASHRRAIDGLEWFYRGTSTRSSHAQSAAPPSPLHTLVHACYVVDGPLFKHSCAACVLSSRKGVSASGQRVFGRPALPLRPPSGSRSWFPPTAQTFPPPLPDLPLSLLLFFTPLVDKHWDPLAVMAPALKFGASHLTAAHRA